MRFFKNFIEWILSGRFFRFVVMPTIVLIIGTFFTIVFLSRSNDVYSADNLVLGEQKIAVILANYQNTTQPSLTKEEAQDVIFNKINDFYKEVSYNKASLSGDVFGWYQLPINQNCDTTGITRNEVIKVADADIYFPNYSIIMVIAPFGTDCSWGGIAFGDKSNISTSDGSVSMYNVYIRTTATTVIAHELAHIFNKNGHSTSLTCKDAKDMISGNCIVSGDVFTILGNANSSLRHINAPHKEKSGWLDSSNILTISTSGVYEIDPLETVSSGAKAIKIPRGNNSFLYIEYRQPIGYDKDLNTTPWGNAPDVFDGALLYITDGWEGLLSPYRDIYLLDPSPSSLDPLSYTLKPGENYTDPATGNKIAVISKTSEKLTLDIALSGKTDLEGPTISLAEPDSGEIVKGSLKIAPTITDPSGIKIVHFNLLNAGPPIASYDGYFPYEIVFDTANIPDGPITVKMKIYDMAGNFSELQRVLVLENANPFIANITSPPDNTVVGDLQAITVSVSDNEKIAKIEFFKDNDATPFAIDDSAPFEVNWDSKAVPDGSHILKIKAYNSAGNFYTSKVNIIVDNITEISDDNNDDSASRDQIRQRINKIIVAPYEEGGPQLRLFKADGTLSGQFFTYEKSFRGGISFAVVDLENDSIKEIITAPGPGREPEIRIFNSKGKLLYKFLAYSKTFRGGVNVAAGDLDGDGNKEIITSSRNGAPQIRIFNFKGGKWTQNTKAFYAYSKNRNYAVNIAVADIDGDGKDEIITAPGAGVPPALKVFGFRNNEIKQITPQFYAYDKDIRYGTNLSAGDIDGDGKDEVITSSLTGNLDVKIFKMANTGKLIVLKKGFFPFGKNAKQGINTASADMDGDGKDEIISSIAGAGQPVVRVFSSDKFKKLKEFKVYPSKSMTGLRLGKW